MREIKFRAWFHKYSDSKKMLFGDDVPLINNCHNSYDFTYMQYTGLKDKNGIDIYEGDIVNCIADSEQYGIGFIRFVAGSFCIEWINDDCYVEPMFTIDKVNSNFNMEVIGNIYENTELLKDKE